MTAEVPSRSAERLGWLDLARVLSAFMILGIHWLRAAYNLRMFDTSDPSTLVVNYQGHSGGWRIFQHLLIAGTGPSLSTWLTNAVGLLGGFGWEAVSALIIISGFSLAVAQRGASLDFAGWLTWFGKRAKRILVPYYLVALPLLTFCGCAILVLRNQHGSIAAVLEAKLVSQFTSPLPGVIVSHLLLFDPWGVQGGANFFAPAWWFVPAILLAYLTYPAIRSASRLGRGIPLLIASAAITIAAYALSNAGLLINETWYYIVLQESFNFSLGVVLGGLWLGAGRPAIERTIADPRAFVIAAIVFVLGNVANWTPSLRPIASMLYGPSLVVMLAFIGKQFESRSVGRLVSRYDSYDLYLVHQPFAFSIALLSKLVFHAYGVFFGWFLFVAAATLAARALSAVRRLRISPARHATPAARTGERMNAAALR